MDGKSISPPELLRVLVECIVNYLCKGVELGFIYVRPTLGPTSKPCIRPTGKRVKIADPLKLSRQAIEFVEEYGRIPPAITIEDVTFGPSELLEATAKAVVYYSRFRQLPSRVEIGDVSDLPLVAQRWNLTERIKSQWGWAILPQGFASSKIEQLTMWQAWTVRPAILHT